MKEKIIKIIVVVIIIIMILIVGGIYFYNYYEENYPKLKEIKIKDQKIEVIKGRVQDIELSPYPKNAKNVNIISSISNPEIVTLDTVDGEIVAAAVEIGESDICFEQENNNKIKKCMKITVVSGKQQFIKRLDDYPFCSKQSEGIYNCQNYILNLNDNTFNSTGDLYYSYHFMEGYIDGHADGGYGYSVDYYYVVNSDSLACTSNNYLLCSYSQQETTKSIYKQFINLFNGILNYCDIYKSDLRY